jgi:dihydroorotase
VVVLDPTAQWTVTPDEFYSKSRNTPFGGRRLRGRADVTIVRGQVVFRRPG